MNHKCGTDKQGDLKAKIIKEKGNRGVEGEHKGGEVEDKDVSRKKV